MLELASATDGTRHAGMSQLRLLWAGATKVLEDQRRRARAERSKSHGFARILDALEQARALLFKRPSRRRFANPQ
jgi:hypothetical protein